METQDKNKAKLGSEPLKDTFGNTNEKPDNIKKDEKPSEEDTISRGAHEDNSSQATPGKNLDNPGK